MKMLITLEDLVKVRPMSKNIPKDRIDPYIREAQINDLEPLLTPVLYYDLMLKIDDTLSPMYANYQKLLNGDVYTPNGYPGPIQYDGIKPALAYNALARFVVNNPISITQYGLVTKTVEQSEPVSAAQIAALASELRANAQLYEQRVTKYLEEKITVYTLYATVDASVQRNQNSAKIFDLQ